MRRAQRRRITGGRGRQRRRPAARSGAGRPPRRAAAAGLRIIDATALRWGVTVTPAQKRIWCDLAAHPPDRDARAEAPRGPRVAQPRSRREIDLAGPPLLVAADRATVRTKEHAMAKTKPHKKDHAGDTHPAAEVVPVSTLLPPGRAAGDGVERATPSAMFTVPTLDHDRADVVIDVLDDRCVR